MVAASVVPPPARGPQGQRAAEVQEVLAQQLQADVPGSRLGAVVQAPAVVAHLDVHLVVPAADGDGGPVGPRVRDDVAQALLQHPVDQP